MRPTPVPETEPAGEVKGTFYWVQNTAWHPVHQLTQLSFLEGCEELGLDCELATTDEGSLEALLAVGEQAIDREGTEGVAMWAGGLPVVAPLIEKAKEKGIGVALPHFPVPEGSFADNAVQIAADTTKYPDPCGQGHVRAARRARQARWRSPRTTLTPRRTWWPRSLPRP